MEPNSSEWYLSKNDQNVSQKLLAHTHYRWASKTLVWSFHKGHGGMSGSIYHPNLPPGHPKKLPQVTKICFPVKHKFQYKDAVLTGWEMQLLIQCGLTSPKLETLTMMKNGQDSTKDPRATWWRLSNTPKSIFTVCHRILEGGQQTMSWKRCSKGFVLYYWQ